MIDKNAIMYKSFNGFLSPQKEDLGSPLMKKSSLNILAGMGSEVASVESPR
jgi:hypothetical protein